MKNYTWKLIFTALLTLMVGVQMWPPSKELKEGIDLKGGSTLVYQLDPEARLPKGVDMNNVVEALRKRLDPTGVKSLVLRKIGADRVEVVLPDAGPTEAKKIEDIITQVGQLEFRILAAQKFDHKAIEISQKLFPEAYEGYQWFLIGDPEEFHPDNQTALSKDGKYVLARINDHEDVTGDDLARAYPTQDQRFQPAVGFEFNEDGGRRFGRLTRAFRPRENGEFQWRLAVILDRKVMSAPSIRSEIHNQGIIEGGERGFSPDRQESLVTILNAGRLPAALQKTPVSKYSMGPTLGTDTIRSGKRAILVSMIAVPIFMFFYYRFAGFVADLALLLNMILLLGSMAFMHATFTLPGLAGLALTIGMAVDANVLIFERIREERERGASVGMAIRNGFSRAWRTIFDAHVTSLLTGFILFYIGTDEVKGFALTLIVGLLWNLFTAVFVSRAIFDLFYDRRWLRDFNTPWTRMMHVFGHTNFDFVGKRYYFITGSIILNVLGLVAFFYRGNNVLDIDFTGGTLITIKLQKPYPTPEPVRERAEAAGLKDVSVEDLNLKDEEPGFRFNIRTTEQNSEQVKRAIVKAFGPELAHPRADVGPVRPIPRVTVKQGQPLPRFARGGQQVTLKFSEAVPLSTVRDRVEDKLRAEKVYDPEQFDLIGVGTPQGDAKNPKYKAVTLQTTLKAGPLATAVAQSVNTDLFFGEDQQINNFGSAVASETQSRAVWAIILSWVAMILYLWFRFKGVAFGLGAVVALIHDVLLTLGLVVMAHYIARTFIGHALRIEDFKINLTMIAAFLTMIGYSSNDTVVVFDRIREVRGRNPELTSKMINDSINQTLSRTILTSFTAWMVVIILYVLGGAGLHGFAYAMIIGIFTGTYSSIYIASPVLIGWAAVHHDHRVPVAAGARPASAVQPRLAK